MHLERILNALEVTDSPIVPLMVVEIPFLKVTKNLSCGISLYSCPLSDLRGSKRLIPMFCEESNDPPRVRRLTKLLGAVFLKRLSIDRHGRTLCT